MARWRRCRRRSLARCDQERRCAGRGRAGAGRGGDHGDDLSAGVGQGPARQAAINAGLPVEVPATTINKVCGSGLKAVALAAAHGSARRRRDRRRGRHGEHDRRALRPAEGALRLPHGPRRDRSTDDRTTAYVRRSRLHMGITAENIAERVRDHPRGAGRVRGASSQQRAARRSRRASSRTRSCRSRSREEGRRR